MCENIDDHSFMYQKTWLIVIYLMKKRWLLSYFLDIHNIVNS